eukprot:3975510-Pleurochrysis_carterae.AAC.1
MAWAGRTLSHSAERALAFDLKTPLKPRGGGGGGRAGSAGRASLDARAISRENGANDADDAPAGADPAA